MISTSTAVAVIGVLFSYIIAKHRTLKPGEELRKEIKNRLQPKYSVTEPSDSEIFPHTDWPNEELWFTVWHVEVYENRWGTWSKWLPRGSFSGRTIIHYKVHGSDIPDQNLLQSHHLARQPYVLNLSTDVHESNIIKVVYESVDPREISRNADQFRHLLRDAVFEELNPDVDLRYELVKKGEDGMYARIFDAGKKQSN